MGHLFTKIQDDTMHEDLVNKLPIEMKSVGLLVYRGERGTVFRVGSKYLMTACHVVKPIIGIFICVLLYYFNFYITFQVLKNWKRCILITIIFLVGLTIGLTSNQQTLESTLFFFLMGQGLVGLFDAVTNSNLNKKYVVVYFFTLQYFKTQTNKNIFVEGDRDWD